MNTLLVEHYLGRIRGGRRYARRATALATLASVLAIGAVAVEPMLAAALAVGALVQGALSVLARSRVRDIVASLALDPTAYVIPEVRAFGEALVVPRRRAELTRTLRRHVRAAARGVGRSLGRRIRAHRQTLEDIADGLQSPMNRIEPAAAAMLWRLLRMRGDSALFDPSSSDDDLASALARVRQGILPAHDRPR